ncbi:hypothetical protein NUW58_g614 [Xylaria curta]|uniref:Uncharacterized protein n=1 Tax=Xylaria curta TaxID=42375 RepID=A0ACC1PPR5_9PEZI|nr:hypothetical protein NUW58_g614 [Xylaria curta]
MVRSNHEYMVCPKAMWRSAWLSKRTLLALVFLFTSLWISLIVLWKYDVTNNGIRLTLGSSHYAWTYGPTAILIVVASLWRQVDYQCKSIQPWQCMQDHPSTAEQSVLLDYISPLQVISFYRAISNSHWPVVCSVLGFAILKLTILASTSLLLPSNTLLVNTYDIRLISSFSASTFWKTIPIDPLSRVTGIDARGIIGAQLEAQKSSYLNVSTGSVYAYWGLSRSDFSYPLGTEDGLAFQIFNTTSVDKAITKLSTVVDAFIPNVTCEIPKWTSFQNASGTQGPLIQMELDTPTCSVGRGEYDPFHNLIDIVAAPMNNESCSEECLPYPTSFTIQRVNCADPSHWAEARAINSTSPHDFRFAVIAANVSENVAKRMREKEMVNEVVGRSVLQAGVVLCNIDYNIVKATAVQDMEASTYSIPGDYKNAHGQYLPGLSGLELSELVYASLCEAAAVFAPPGINPAEYVGVQDSFASNPLFTVMTSHLNGSQNRERFFDSATLQIAAQDAFTGISAQLMQQSFVERAELPAVSEGVYQEVRLHVNHVSMWIMVVGFLILTLAATIITLTATRRVVPQDPRSIATHASILAASPSLKVLLHESGSLRTSELKTLLAGFHFQTIVGKHFRIMASQQGGAEDCLPKPNKVKTDTWLPLSAKLPFFTLTLALPVLAIGTLEILYRISIAHKGLADAPVESALTSYVIRFSSSLVILVIATCFNSLDFTIITFAPFSSLRTGASSFSGSMLANIQGVTPLLVLYRSVKHGQIGVALSTITTLVGSILTVFGSGLWVLNDRATFDSNVTTSASHTWNLTPSNASIAGSGAALVFNNLERDIARLPPNVWNDLVFPHLSKLALSGSSSDLSPDFFNTPASNCTLTLPALRPELDCDTVPNRLINVTIEVLSDDISVVSFEAHWNLPPGCYGGPNANRTYLTALGGATHSTWYGTFQDVHMGPWDDSNHANSELGDQPAYDALRVQADNPLGCPSLVAVFGHLNMTHTTQNDVTMFVCNQKIQQVNTTVTYLGDPRNGDVSLSQPPVTDESTAKYLTNGTEGIDAFNYRIDYDLFMGLMPFNKGEKEPEIDNFFNHLIYGPNGIPREQLLGPQNAPRLLEAIQRLYKGYMVHVINRNFRQPIKSSGLSHEPRSRTISGTATREIGRLTIDYPSKLALQIVLATMVVLGAIAFRLANLRGTLPRNPCSIASVMGFLAGSELCSSGGVMPEGGEWMSREELEKSLDRWLFSLGWWTRNTSPETRNDPVNGRQNDISQQANTSTGTRFGIDVGTPVELGYRGKQERKRAGKSLK